VFERIREQPAVPSRTDRVSSHSGRCVLCARYAHPLVAHDRVSSDVTGVSITRLRPPVTARTTCGVCRWGTGRVRRDDHPRHSSTRCWRPPA